MIVHKVGVPRSSTSLQLLHIFYPSVFWLGHLLAIPTATSASQQSPWHPKPKRLVSHASLYAPSIKQVSLNSTCPLLLPFKTPPPPPPLHHTLSLSLTHAHNTAVWSIFAVVKPNLHGRAPAAPRLHAGKGAFNFTSSGCDHPLPRRWHPLGPLRPHSSRNPHRPHCRHPTFRDLQPNPGPRSSGSRTGYHRIPHLRRLRNHRTVFTLLDCQLPPERPRNGANGACKVESAGGGGPVGHEGEGSWAWNPRQGTRNYKDMN